MTRGRSSPNRRGGEAVSTGDAVRLGLELAGDIPSTESTVYKHSNTMPLGNGKFDYREMLASGGADHWCSQRLKETNSPHTEGRRCNYGPPVRHGPKRGRPPDTCPRNPRAAILDFLDANGEASRLSHLTLEALLFGLPSFWLQIVGPLPINDKLV